MRPYRLLSVALLALAATVPEAKAVYLPPNGSAQTLGATITPPAFQTLTSITTAFSESNGTFATLTGRLVTTVYKLKRAVVEGGIHYAAGDLVFGYRVSVTKPFRNSANLTRLGLNGFTLSTSQYDAELTRPLGTTPKDVAYSGANSLIAVRFAPGIAAGLSNEMMLIFTNATKYVGSTASVSGTGATGQGGLAIYAPTPFSATPEPGTIALACAALPVLGLYQFRRRRTQNA